jgi:hypothetical protein
MQFDASKIGAVRRYLENEFPGADVDDIYNSDRFAQDFRIGHGASSCLVTVSGEFLRDQRADEIGNVLRRWHLARSLRDVGKSRVIVTTTGLASEPLGTP